MLCFEDLQKGHLLLQSGIFLGYMMGRWPVDVEVSCKGGNTPNNSDWYANSNVNGDVPGA